MKFNPAYFAALDLQKNFISIEFRQNKDNVSYCMIHLPNEKSGLMLGGKNYQPEKIPHFSIYELYQENKKNGLSIFHYTWYGFLEEDSKKKSVVLHVYFDRIGRYLYCQLKDLESNELIQNISKVEEKLIQQQAKASSEKEMNALLEHITQSYTKANESVNDYLNKLDELSLNIKTQLPKYKITAKDCLEAMAEKDKWTFGQADLRAKLLKEIVFLVEENSKNQQAGLLLKKSSLYSSPKKKENRQPQQPSVENNQKQKSNDLKIANENLTTNLKNKLIILDDQINSSNKATNKSTAEKQLITLDLLNKKVVLLIQAKTTTFLENELFKVLTKINSVHKAIQLLFEKEAKSGNVEALILLKPYVPVISLKLLCDLVDSGTFDVWQFLVQNFDECLLYLNQTIISPPYKNYKEMVSLLGFICLKHQDSAILEMLLKNGANPNFLGITCNGYVGLLRLAISQKKEKFVKVLLENGADPNAKAKNSEEIVLSSSKIEISSFPTDNKAIAMVENKPYGLTIPNNDQPLIEAICSRNTTVIHYLLLYGASIQQQQDNLDVFGWETCKSFTPNLATVKLLIEKGADINAVKTVEKSQKTALINACVRNNHELIMEYLALGANPNQQVQKLVTKSGNQVGSYYLSTTALCEAATNNHFQIVESLISQNIQPISYITAAMTVATFIRQAAFEIDHNNLSIHFKSSEAIALIKIYLDGFTKDTKDSALKIINPLSEYYYKSKNYEQALIYFYVSLIFGEQENRQSLLCNIGSCYKMCKEQNLAVLCYQACEKYDCKNKIGKTAAAQLEKLSSPCSVVSIK